MRKVVIIGAGSFAFSSKLISDILTFRELADTHFVLVDIDERRLDYARQIAERIFQDGNYDRATVTAESDRARALAGADYVIVSILVGGYEAIAAEIDIPVKYGVRQCIGDTLTPGGIMRCLRTLPEMIAIGRDVMEQCPRALVLNYTNPMSMLCWGMFDACPDLRLVGLCHSVQGTTQGWAERLGVPIDEVTFDCAGINHQAWVTRFEHAGEDLLPKIRELALEPRIWTGDSVRMEYVKHFGYPVTESSGHVSEYNPWFRKNEVTLERYCDPKGGRWNGKTGFIKELYDRPDWEERMRSMASGETPIDLSRSLEYGSRILNAHHTGEPVTIHGNVKNDGWIAALPETSVVEVAVEVDGDGFHPRPAEIPPHLAAINRGQIAVQELAVRAVGESDPERVFQAMAIDPLTAMACTLDEIRAMTRELMDAHDALGLLGGLHGHRPAERPILFDKKVADAEVHVDPSEE